MEDLPAKIIVSSAFDNEPNAGLGGKLDTGLNVLNACGGDDIGRVARGRARISGAWYARVVVMCSRWPIGRIESNLAVSGGKGLLKADADEQY